MFLLTCLLFGYAFFYIPVFSMIFFSFNKSRLATVWGGFSTEWYGRLLSNDQVIAAALLSLKIALISATLATIFGTMAGMALARFRRFTGRTLFSGLVLGTAHHAGGHHRPVDASALRLYGAVDRLAERPGGDHRDHRPHHLLHVLCCRRGPLPPRFHGPVARGGRHGPGLEAVAGAVRHHPAVDRTGDGLGLAARLYPVARRRGHHQFHQWPRHHHPADLYLGKDQAWGHPGH